MGWYAELSLFDSSYEEMIETVQFFIDCMDYEDSGDHYRGAQP